MRQINRMTTTKKKQERKKTTWQDEQSWKRDWVVTSAQAPRVPPNEPLNIPWPKKYHSASSKRGKLASFPWFSLPPQTNFFLFLLPNKYFPKQGKEAEKVWTQHLAFKSK